MEEMYCKTEREIQAYDKGVNVTHKYWEDKIRDKIKELEKSRKKVEEDAKN